MMGEERGERRDWEWKRTWKSGMGGRKEEEEEHTDKGRKRNRNTGEEIWRRKKGERKTMRGGKRGRERIIEERDKRKNGWRRE